MRAFITFILIISVYLPEAYAGGQKKTVLVIESYHKEMYWDAAYRNGIKKIIGDKATLFFFEMDTKRLPKSKYLERTALAIAEIDRVNPDIIMLGDDNALSFVGKEVLKRKIPLVFLGINGNPRDYFGGKIPKGITGVLERPPLKRFLRFIRQSQLKWHKILILFDGSNTSKIYEKDPFFFQGKDQAKYLNFDVEVYFSNNLDELKEKVLSAQSTHDALFLGGLNTVIDSSGKHVKWDKITQWIYKKSTIPLFGFWKGNVGFNKSIGGYVADGQDMGEQVANLVLKILQGISPRNISIERSKDGRLVLSRTSLTHWNINIPKKLMLDAVYID